MFSANDVSGINEQTIDNIMLKELDCRDRLKNIFSRMEETIATTSQYYDCDSGNALRAKFAEIQRNFEIVLANLESYNTELAKVKTNFKEFTSNLSAKVSTNPEDFLKLVDTKTGVWDLDRK